MSVPTPLPTSSRGRATRERLILGARTVFEEHGFVDARVAEITREAKVAYGSFYTHFASKEEIFAAVASRLFEEMFAPEDDSPAADSPRARLERANQTYWDRYRRNARLMGIVEQVAAIDTEFALVRIEHRRVTYARTAASIRRWQESGHVAADLDPDIAAQALGAMVDRTLYLRCVMNEGEPNDAALATLNRLSVQALGLSNDS